MGSLVYHMVVAVVLIASATTHGMEGNHLSLSLSSSSNDFASSFQRFIRSVRKQLIAKTDQLYGIPILRNDVPDSERFLLFELSDGMSNTITLAIDVKNVGFVGYSANNISYILLDVPREAVHAIFPNSASQVFLDFKSDYESLESAAGITRRELLLAYFDFTTAITNLFDYNQELLPQSFLVFTQMILEPMKFKFIEHSIINLLRKNTRGFYPGFAMLSLEDNWVKLSSKIQASVSLQGLFGTTIDLYDSNDEIIRVDSIHYPIITTNIALMLYHCEADATNRIIRMPSDPMSDSDSCYVGRLRRNTRITGREGLCMNTEYVPYAKKIPVTLKSCREQVIRDWRFKDDGTIHTPFGYCLTFNPKNFAVVSINCSKVEASTAKWKVSIDGTITNLNSGLVLTANASTNKTKLRVKPNTKAFGQGWRVGSYVDPITTTIIGLHGMCLEATNNNTNTWLEECVKNKNEQSWALYGDGSIRVNNDRNLCVSSPTDGSVGLVSIFSCVGSANQRWVFKVDGTVMNPKTEMSLAVESGDVSLKRIILKPTTGSAEEEWTLFY